MYLRFTLLAQVEFNIETILIDIYFCSLRVGIKLINSMRLCKLLLIIYLYSFGVVVGLNRYKRWKLKLNDYYIYKNGI